MVAALALPSELSKDQVKELEEFSFIRKLELTFYRTKTNADRIAFWSFTRIDVYQLIEHVKYKCIKEMNPLLDHNPTVSDMVLLKYFTVGHQLVLKHLMFQISFT